MNLAERLSKAWSALMGQSVPPTASVPMPNPENAEVISARMRLELEAARQEITRLREEYSRLEGRAQEDLRAAGREAVVRLAKRVTPLLSQLATMRALVEQGREVRREDILLMASKLEAAFLQAGLVPIGQVGAEAAFDPKFHQRMSGGEVRNGDAVRVRFVGYLCEDAVVTKAMVSPAGEAKMRTPEEGS